MIDVRGTIRTIIKPTALAVMVAAALAMTIADMYGDRDLFRFAVTAWLVAATTYLAGRTGITAKVIELARQGGYEAGYDGGYADGHEIGYSEGRKFPQPVLLAQSADCGGPKAVPLVSAAQ